MVSYNDKGFGYLFRNTSSAISPASDQGFEKSLLDFITNHPQPSPIGLPTLNILPSDIRPDEFSTLWICRYQGISGLSSR